MSKGKVTVLGISGRIGGAAAEAFVAAGWDVAGMVRSAGKRIAGVTYVEGNSDSVADLKRAIGDAQVVINALNMRYDQWYGGRMEAQMARVAEAMGKGRTMLFPGNIYSFPASLRVVTPDAKQIPQTPRGAIRVRVEDAYEAAARRGDMQVIIIRAGDFYGPRAKGDWFDEIIFRERKAKASIPGQPGVGHSWAYLPDLARAFEKLASRREELGAFERFHFAGNFITPEELGAVIQRVAPMPIKVEAFPMWILVAMGLFSPLVREVAKMRYLWRHPMELQDKRLDALLGPGFATPFETAVAAAVAPYFPSDISRKAELSGAKAV